MIDLDSEMTRAASLLRRRHFDRLVALGCPLAALARLSSRQHTIGFGRIEVGSGGLFQFVEDGSPALIQAVVDPDRELGETGIVDLLAWTSDNPLSWAWRLGRASLLGADLLDAGGQVDVVDSPLAWLAAEGRAVVILDWGDASVWPLLRNASQLSFTDPGLRQRVRNALVASAPMPSLEILDAA